MISVEDIAGDNAIERLWGLTGVVPTSAVLLMCGIDSESGEEIFLNVADDMTSIWKVRGMLEAGIDCCVSEAIDLDEEDEE